MAGRTAIGLDIGTSVVRAVELSFGRGGLTLERFGQVVLPEGVVRDGEVVDREPVVACLRQLWSATGFSHKKVVMGVANQRVIVRQLELPWMPREELRASLPFQVQDFLPMPTDQAVLDFFPLEERSQAGGARTLNGLLVAAARDTVLANVNCAERAGLSVSAVDLTSFAVLRALGKQTGVEVETEALIDVGARITNVVVHSCGAPRFVRILLMGGQDVTDAVAEGLGITSGEAEALKQQVSGAASEDETATLNRAVSTTAQDFVEEIRGSLDYYAASHPGAPVERILLSGGGSRLAGLVERLATATRLPVLPADPLASVRIGKTGLDADQLEFVRPLAAVPVGLALGAI
ncbi:MAG TPA: type IV pilus assembly protein PilM [Kineosporiaceae bacterium]|nr:type IV pilus assembly protein PilM [Kineosporiaceae bacterium]